MPALAALPHPDDEQTTIARAADGDAAAREALARTWTPRVYRFAWRLLRDEQDARDVAQEVMVRVLDQLDRYDPGRPFSTWVYACARNRCIDEQRRRLRRPTTTLPPDATDPSPSPAMRVHAAREADRVREALDRLPPAYREILVLYHFEHLRYVDIAALLDIPLGTVMNRIFRARRKLAEVLDPAPPEPSA